jgi:hypothetical protein
MALGVLLPSFSNGVRSVEVSAEHVSTIMLARSIISRVGLDIAWSDGETSGTAEGGFDWVLRMRRLEPADAASVDQKEHLPVVPVEVVVVVSKGGKPTLALETLRLAPVQ